MASVSIFGADKYAMRCWVNPDKLSSLGITVPEIINAIQAQNNVNPAGQIGGDPVPPGQQFTTRCVHLGVFHLLKSLDRLLSARNLAKEFSD